MGIGMVYQSFIFKGHSIPILFFINFLTNKVMLPFIYKWNLIKKRLHKCKFQQNFNLIFFSLITLKFDFYALDFGRSFTEICYRNWAEILIPSIIAFYYISYILICKRK